MNNSTLPMFDNDGWNPLMGQAPRDGSEILVARHDLPEDRYFTTAYWSQEKQCWHMTEFSKLDWEPTFWRYKLRRPLCEPQPNQDNLPEPSSDTTRPASSDP
jgi:hypothetical protein